MGQVFRGEDRRLGRPVAVKILACDQSADQDAVRRFLNEARSAARLNHQNIAQVYSAGESDNHPYIVFEFVEGANLRVMIEEQGPLMLEEALSYTMQIADALSHAADRRIVHRDVKPSNVLITPNGQAKLIDLGLARLSAGASPDGDLTASGVTLGTFDYISPEQARDPRNADSRSDIYSLGCTLFFMLTGRPPFPEGTVLQKLLQHQGDEPPDVCQFRPDIPEDVSLVLGKMMAKDPRRRYPDFPRLMEALFSLADQIGMRPVGPSQAVWLPPQESRISVLHRQTPWLAPALVLACVIFVSHLVWSGQGNTADLQDFRILGARPLSAQTIVEAGSASRPMPDTPVSDEPPTLAAGAADPATSLQDPSTPPIADESGSSTAVQPPSASPNEASLVAAPIQQPGSGSSQLGPSPVMASLSPASLSAGISPPSVLGRVVGGSLGSSSVPPTETVPTSAPTGNTMSAVALIVTRTPKDATQFSSIAAALAADPDASVIELSYDGFKAEKPLSLVNRQLTIRAAAGQSPVVGFQPTGIDPTLYPRDMIRVSGGRLTVEGVAIELEIPRDMPSESWTLMRLSAEGRVYLKGCTLRVRNASDTFGAFHQDVAFFRTSPQEISKAALVDPTRLDRTADIKLEDCLACGEGSFLQAAESQPLMVTWNNGLLVTSEPGFSIGGNPRVPNLGAMMEISWQNVTAKTGGALFQFTLASHRPHLVPVRFSGSACVLSGRQMIAATGLVAEDALSALLGRLTWNSKPEDTVIHGSTPPVSFVDAEGRLIQNEVLDEWLQKTSGLPASVPQRNIWQGVAPDGPTNSMGPEHFMVNQAEIGLPANAAPGFLVKRIPGVPPPKPVEHE